MKHYTTYLLAILLSLLWGCGFRRTAQPPLASYLPRCVLTDSYGDHIVLYSYPKRIVSLAPSNTEIVWDLGAQNRLVADTTADDYPPPAKKLPKVGDMMHAPLDNILAYHPDIVLALGGLNDQEIRALRQVGVPILVENPRNLHDVYKSILQIGAVLGRELQAQALVARMKQRIAQLTRIVQRAKRHPRVLMIYQLNPIYTTGPGSFICDAIQAAGGINAVQKPLYGDTLSPEEAVVLQPDVIVCSPNLVSSILRVPGWAQSVPAVRFRRFFRDDGPQATLVRPTPRLINGIEQLAKYLHPTLFSKAKGIYNAER